MATDSKVLTVGELSDYLRVHRSTIYRLLKKGQLPAFKIGSDWRFTTDDPDDARIKLKHLYPLVQLADSPVTDY